jgi:putative selenate reductase
MIPRAAPLQPWPLDRLLARIAREWDSDKAVFSLAGRRFWKAQPGLDLACESGGRHVATPVSPAAGSQTQMAQNLALGWLTGVRTFEFKTVQILDHLDIPRLCLDMEHEGCNVEWSHERTLG